MKLHGPIVVNIITLMVRLKKRVAPVVQKTRWFWNYMVSKYNFMHNSHLEFTWCATSTQLDDLACKSKLAKSWTHAILDMDSIIKQTRVADLLLRTRVWFRILTTVIVVERSHYWIKSKKISTTQSVVN